jgi:hypothetical protein
MFDRGDIRLECFKRETHNYRLAVADDSSQISCQGKTKLFLFLLSLTRRDNER